MGVRVDNAQYWTTRNTEQRAIRDKGVLGGKGGRFLVKMGRGFWGV